MKKVVQLLIFAPFVFFAQHDPSNGEWKQRNIFKEKTPECDYMIRQGDIDNLGFGWEENFNPFTGKSTPSHGYPWEADSTEISGYDMIMIPSSYGTKDMPCGGDGYSGQAEPMKEKYGKTVWDFTIPVKGADTSKIKSVSLQMFVDDFQSPEFCSKFYANLNGLPFPALTKTLNSLSQGGPIGKLITVKVPENLIKEFKKKEIKIFIDDNTTGAGDGFAIDFIKIMINPKAFIKGNLSGTLTDESTGNIIPGATMEIGDTKVKTDAKGMYKFTGLIAGYAVVTVNAPGYPEKTFNVDIEENQTTIQDFTIKKE